MFLSYNFCSCYNCLLYSIIVIMFFNCSSYSSFKYTVICFNIYRSFPYENVSFIILELIYINPSKLCCISCNNFTCNSYINLFSNCSEVVCCFSKFFLFFFSFNSFKFLLPSYVSISYKTVYFLCYRI